MHYFRDEDFNKCTVSQKKKKKERKNEKRKNKKHPYLFQYKLLYRNENGINHHGLMSTSV